MKTRIRPAAGSTAAGRIRHAAVADARAESVNPPARSQAESRTSGAAQRPRNLDGEACRGASDAELRDVSWRISGYLHKGRNGQATAGSCFVSGGTSRLFRLEAGRCNLPLDEIDLRILEELQRDSSRTNVLLARIVGLSPPACLRRVRRLRASGAIRREVAVLDPRIAGLHMHVLAGVVLERESRDLIAAFKRRMVEDEAIAQCWYVTGQYDFLVLVRVRDVAAYEALGERLFHADPNVKRYESLVVLDEVKRDFAVPLGVVRRAG